MIALRKVWTDLAHLQAGAAAIVTASKGHRVDQALRAYVAHKQRIQSLLLDSIANTALQNLAHTGVGTQGHARGAASGGRRDTALSTSAGAPISL